MTEIQNRKHPRFDSLNLLEYVVVDEDGNPSRSGMGRTLNVSEGGILLETTEAFETGRLLWVSIGIENDLVEVEGTVVHGTATTPGRFRTGLEFRNVDKDGQRVLDRYLALYLDHVDEQG